MSLSQPEKERLKSVKRMEQFGSSVVENFRVVVPRQRNDEQQCRCCARERKENFVLMIVTNETDCMGGSDEQGIWDMG